MPNSTHLNIYHDPNIYQKKKKKSKAIFVPNGLIPWKFCHLKDTDVVRHELVRRIINAYDRYYKKYPEETEEE